MELNLNNKFVTRELDKPREVTQRQFWEYYLRLVNINNPFLTDREIDVLAYILSLDYQKSVFARGRNNDIAKATRMSKQQLTRVKKSLISKEFLMGDIDILPHPNLRSFQKYVQSSGNKDFVFKFPYKITEK